METVPTALKFVFPLITAFTVWQFYRAANKSRTTLYVLLAWLALQAALGLSGFYTANSAATPPRLMLAVLPPVLLTVGLLLTTRGRAYLDSLRIDRLTLLHTVRIFVELGLLVLYMHHAVPKLMTFEGRNWDIFSGLSAPVVYFLVFRRQVLGRSALLFWNLLCLGLVLNILVNALLAIPGPFQQFGFEQPNVAVLYFPFVWLPSCVVPLVIVSHLAAIRQLLTGKPLLGDPAQPVAGGMNTAN
ncbi:MAG: hypothetical protein ACRYFX_07915 [Janthinobacterium lividum]